MVKEQHWLQNISAVIVTGGSSGIGKSFISNIYNINPKIIFCNISRSQPNFSKKKNLRLHHFPCDLIHSDETKAACHALLKTIQEETSEGEILLINNSGFGLYGAFPTLDLQRQLDMIDLNAKAVVHITGLLLELLNERGGYIINVSSTSAFQPTPELAVYGATKAFLLNWSLALGDDLRLSNIHVFCLCPGPTSTNFFKAAGFSKPVVSRLGHEADEVVMGALKAVGKQKTLAVTGLLNTLASWPGKWLPRPWITSISGLILRKVRRGCQ